MEGQRSDWLRRGAVLPDTHRRTAYRTADEHERAVDHSVRCLNRSGCGAFRCSPGLALTGQLVFLPQAPVQKPKVTALVSIDSIGLAIDPAQFRTAVALGTALVEAPSVLTIDST
jgi:hypothetical protein